MDEFGELMATYEAELRQVADTFGGQVDVWRKEPAEVIPFLSGAIADVPPHDSQVIEGEFEEVEFEAIEFNPDAGEMLP